MDGISKERDIARGNWCSSKDCFHQGGLPGTIWAGDCDALSLGNRCGDAVKNEVMVPGDVDMVQ